jgi:hypothetical protein
VRYLVRPLVRTEVWVEVWAAARTEQMGVQMAVLRVVVTSCSPPPLRHPAHLRQARNHFLPDRWCGHILTNAGPRDASCEPLCDAPLVHNVLVRTDQEYRRRGLRIGTSIMHNNGAKPEADCGQAVLTRSGVE